MTGIRYVFLLLLTIYSISSESLRCYECSGHISCGQGETALIVECSGKCMVYLNVFDSNTVVRRCCTSNCGSSESIGDYEGRTTYFCSSNLCNQAGAEALLTGGTTSSSPTTRSTSLSSTQIITTATEQPSFQCYDCSGADCGQDGSTLLLNCPTCMVYRNSYDQTIIERRCCSWNCGPSNSISMFNGIETYFCSFDKCNGNGAENILRPPVTTTTSITTSTSSSASCTLNCKNGGILETVDGCFCYCPSKTIGRECENIECARPDDDPGICIPENRPLCSQSEIFIYKCLHLCGIC